MRGTMSRSASLIKRCPECSEAFCTTCEPDCPVCCWGAGIETAVRPCAECGEEYCEECERMNPCPECDAPICRGCWDKVSSCASCRDKPDLGAEDDGPPEGEINLQHFQIWEGEHRDFSNADPEAWRATWTRKQKPKPWKVKPDGD